MTRAVPHRDLVTEIRLRAVSITLAFVLGLVTVVGTSSAQAQTYKETVLYSFTGGSGHGNPWAGLIWDGKGNLYGTTEYGGASNAGAVFKVSSKGKETLLHSFTGGSDGGYPQAGLIMDAKGNLYGTTSQGGNSGCNLNGTPGCGVVFKLDTTSHETVLHSFTGKPDGAIPRDGLILDANGNLYGTTLYGGASLLGGVVFKVSKTGRETILYRFTNLDEPQGGVIFDAKGNLYGTTTEGGTFSAGSVFKIDTTGKETVLYNFTGGPDGGGPVAGLVFDAKGNLYGTTYGGGASGFGTVFELNKKGRETVLYSFTGGADGRRPVGGVIFDSKGNLYGTTSLGGTHPCLSLGCGTVFKLDTTGKETVLHSFNGKDGFEPVAVLIFDAKGNLYSTTYEGGASNAGVVLKLIDSGPSSLGAVR